MTVIELTKALMDIPSLTEDEKELGLFVSDYLARKGFSVEKQYVTDDRFNVVAIMGTPKVLLCTHLDTVPPYIPFSEDDVFIYGRGACDAKGIMAAMLVAGDRLALEKNRNFGYLFTVGEEVESIGARVAGRSGLRAEYLIVGEPTDNKLALGHKGNLTFSLMAAGRAAHSAYPEQGESAVDKLLDVLHDLRHADFGTDPVLGKATINIGVIAGGVRANVVPDQAMAKIVLRAVTAADEVEACIREVIGNRVNLEIINKVDPQRMIEVEGFPTTVVSFGTDIPYLRGVGKPLLIGPGSILTAHSQQERIAKGELDDAVMIYYQLVLKVSSFEFRVSS
jgi:acetylornithine deacetylase